MIVAMLVTQIFGYLLFLSDRWGFGPLAHLENLAARVRAPIELVLATPVAERTAKLQSLSSADFELAALPAFDPSELIANIPPVGRARGLLLDRLPGLVDQILIEGRLPEEPGPPPFMSRADPQQIVVLWLRLADRSWLTVRLPLRDLLPPPPFYPWTPWALAFATIIAISLLAARGISRPLQRFADAAERLGVNIETMPLAESGPGEIRSVTRSFNLMQARLKRFVDDRTQMLAAISHDLRTPLSRLRMRAEAQDPSFAQRKNLADLDLMDRMIAATLSFARDDVAGEARVKVDLASLAQSVCDEITDAGGTATYQGPLYLEIEAAPLSLMRAITNVVENAVKYGGRAEVKLAARASWFEITVADSGPGIPNDLQERVFEPFYRVDPARSPDGAAEIGELGGTGLGLAIARHAFRAHGGDISLANRATGGLVATLILPRAAYSA
jgi:signal transduction histidine kinase